MVAGAAEPGAEEMASIARRNVVFPEPVSPSTNTRNDELHGPILPQLVIFIFFLPPTLVYLQQMEKDTKSGARDLSNDEDMREERLHVPGCCSLSIL